MVVVLVEDSLVAEALVVDFKLINHYLYVEQNKIISNHCGGSDSNGSSVDCQHL